MTKKELEIMFMIAKKAKEKGLLMFDTISLVMDLKIVSNIFTMNLEGLLQASDQDFSHDITGIQENVDRRNKTVRNEFLPRYTEGSKQ